MSEIRVEKREKKYYVKLNGRFETNNHIYLNHYLANESLFFGWNVNIMGYKVEFTKEEAEKYKQIVMDSLEIVEVE